MSNFLKELLKLNESKANKDLNDFMEGNLKVGDVLDFGLEGSGTAKVVAVSKDKHGDLTVGCECLTAIKVGNEESTNRVYTVKPGQKFRYSENGLKIVSDLSEAKDSNRICLELTFSKEDFPRMSDKKIEREIFGIEEEDGSFIQDQEIVTVEYITVKNGVVKVYPMLDIDPSDVKSIEKELQAGFDLWLQEYEEEREEREDNE